MNKFLIGFFISLIVANLISSIYLRIGGYEINTGVSFGLVEGIENSIVVLVYVVFSMWISHEISNKLRGQALALGIMSGAFAGMVNERILYGGVIDYIDLLSLVRSSAGDILVVSGLSMYIANWRRYG